MERVIKYLSEYTEIPEADINQDSELINDLNLSSYDIVEMTCDLEDMFETEIKSEELANIKTVGDLYRLLSRI